MMMYAAAPDSAVQPLCTLIEICRRILLLRKGIPSNVDQQVHLLLTVRIKQRIFKILLYVFLHNLRILTLIEKNHRQKCALVQINAVFQQINGTDRRHVLALLHHIAQKAAAPDLLYRTLRDALLPAALQLIQNRTNLIRTDLGF